VKLIPLSTFGLMTTVEVAARHGCTDQTVWRWIALGLLPAVRVGEPTPRLHLVRRRDCEGFTKPRPWPRTPEKRTHARGKRGSPTAAVAAPLSEFGLMTVRQLAEYHGCAEHTACKWVAEGRLPAVAVLGVYLVRREDCEAFQKPKTGRPPGRKTRTKKKNPAG
jgi:excisionase family DNA binding protein